MTYFQTGYFNLTAKRTNETISFALHYELSKRFLLLSISFP